MALTPDTPAAAPPITSPPPGLALLRAPFQPNQISKLPKPLKRRDEMDKLPKAKCAECGGYHATSAVVHLDYVGHAALTDRLLDADPCWTWVPLAWTGDGLPLFDKVGGLWITLTVCGVTRYGYGHAGDKSGGDATKEIIGDALRNAAMRFGAALDLWHKGDLHADEPDASRPKRAAQPAPVPTPRPTSTSTALITEPQRKRLWALLKKSGRDENVVKLWLEARYKIASSKAIPQNLYDAICEAISAPGPLALEEREPGEDDGAEA